MDDGRVPSDNSQLSSVFDLIARLLEVKRDSPFKIRAYRNAARVIASYPEDLRELVARGDDLRAIPGIGEAIAKKTVELLTTGRLEFLESLKQSVSEGVLTLLQVKGIGPRTAARLADELAISSVDELETALRSGSLAGLPGFGDKKSGALLKAVEAYRASSTRGDAHAT